jgi:hypothetical protein
MRPTSHRTLLSLPLSSTLHSVNLPPASVNVHTHPVYSDSPKQFVSSPKSTRLSSSLAAKSRIAIEGESHVTVLRIIAFVCEVALLASALHLPAASRITLPADIVLASSPDQSPALNVNIENIPAAVVLVRDVTGPYSQHPVVFKEMMDYVGKNYRAVGACFGIYSNDPDAVKSGNLRWQVGVRVTQGAPLGFGNNLPISTLKSASPAQLRRAMSRLKPPEKPYHLQVLDPAEAAVVESTVARSPKDGLAMFPWMAENGYVQVAPTRMEYLSHEGPPQDIKVRIIVPVQKRASGVKLDD